MPASGPGYERGREGDTHRPLSKRSVAKNKGVAPCLDPADVVKVLFPIVDDSAKKMKDMEWRDEYALGIPAIDIQHQRIFDCFVSILRGSGDDDRLRVEFEIVRLLGLLQEHFSLEESMMQSLNYVDTEQHVEEHRRFHADVHELAQKSLRKKGGVSREAIKMVHKWLKEHIMTSDRDYVVFFSNPARKRGLKKQSAK